MAIRSPTPRKLDILYKDCIIIGNGPSAINLSYFLSGNWPYYNRETLSDQYVQVRLSDNPDQSLITQDLEYLSEGLEGRSLNPGAILFDLLSHPNADLGLLTPSALNWKYHSEHRVDHVVLGKGKLGGVWQQIDGSVNTLSLGDWMELPDMPFREWLHSHHERHRVHDAAASPIKDRATIADVRQYYIDYVCEKNLQENFLDGHWVTSVQKVLHGDVQVDCDSGEYQIVDVADTDSGQREVLWEVCGQRLVDLDDNNNNNNASAMATAVNDDLSAYATENFCYRTRNVVLAVGSHDQANRLGVPGESLPYVMHSVQEFETAIRDGLVGPDSDSVVIVGAGLSVGDAIVLAEHCALSIVHVFRRRASDPEMVFHQLPVSMYPEYHRIHGMMAGQHGADDHYVPYEAHVVSQFMPDRQVIIHDVSDHQLTPKIIQASVVLVLIGSKPDLSFMRNSGYNLGVKPGFPVDSKFNRMDVNPFTYESNVESGLFGMGALVGDNFVRFLLGGGLGICSRLVSTRADRSNVTDHDLTNRNLSCCHTQQNRC